MHADDLQAVEHSRSAKRFEKHAQRREKEALLSIQDLDQGTFTDDTPQGRGPRDFTGSSWLDTDSVMDRYGDDFTPPNPSIGHVKISKLVFWVLLIAGVAGIIASAFMPALAGIDVQLRTSEHRSMYSYVRLSIDRCTATYV